MDDDNGAGPSAIVAPDLVKRDFRTLGPNQLWVAVTVKSVAYPMPQTGEDAQNAVGDGAFQLTLRASLASLAASPSAYPPSNDFFKWLIVREKQLMNPMVDAHQQEGEPPVRLVHALTAEEMMKIIQSSTPTTALGLRDRAILELLYSTGIRRRELVNLNVGDFRVESHELLVVNGKGGKDRVVPVGQWACYFTEAYMKNVRPWQVCNPTEKALFVQHRNGRRLSSRAVGDIVERATARSGVGRRVGPHTFRHSMATHMLRNHADLRHIQAILGHTSLRSTQIYTHADIEDLKGVIKRSHPHGKRGRLQATTFRNKIDRESQSK